MQILACGRRKGLCSGWHFARQICTFLCSGWHFARQISTSGVQHGRPKTGSRATTASTGQRLICSSQQLVWIHTAGGQITQKHLTMKPHTIDRSSAIASPVRDAAVAKSFVSDWPAASAFFATALCQSTSPPIYRPLCVTWNQTQWGVFVTPATTFLARGIGCGGRCSRAAAAQPQSRRPQCWACGPSP